VTNIGRNEPCPCGSGKKYKHCHLKLGSGGVKNQAAVLNEEIAAELAGHEFTSMEDLQANLDEFVHRRNRTPLPEFHGLSSDAMQRLLYDPFDSPEIVTLPEVLDTEPSAQISDLFMLLADELSDGGLKLTEKGNLPRAFSRTAAELYSNDVDSEGPFYLGPYPVNKEADFKALEVTRIVAGLAGLVRKYRGRLELTRKARRLLEDHGVRGVYPALLRAYVEDFNWPYADRYEELSIIQRSWAFTAYLLTRYGGETRPTEFYSDQFLHAFPAAVAEVEGHPFWEPEDVISRCFRVRALERFAEFFGLVRVEHDGTTRVLADLRIASLPLLGDAVRFTV